MEILDDLRKCCYLIDKNKESFNDNQVVALITLLSSKIQEIKAEFEKSKNKMYYSIIADLINTLKEGLHEESEQIFKDILNTYDKITNIDEIEEHIDKSTVEKWFSEYMQIKERFHRLKGEKIFRISSFLVSEALNGLDTDIITTVVYNKLVDYIADYLDLNWEYFYYFEINDFLVLVELIKTHIIIPKKTILKLCRKQRNLTYITHLPQLIELKLDEIGVKIDPYSEVVIS